MRGPNDPITATWNDLPNNGGGSAGNIYGVVEVVPEPQVMTMISLGTIALMMMRRKKP